MSGLIVHEWAEKSGGAEKVVEQMVLAFPSAELQVLWNDAPDRFPNAHETWLAKTAFRHHKALALPLLPATWRLLKARVPPEWILASSHLFAHHVRPLNIKSGTPKYAYVHTPARYIWEPNLDHRGRNKLALVAAPALKAIDRRRAKEVTKIAANSAFTRERIRRVWELDAEVIYPPVDTELIVAGGDWRNHLAEPEIRELDSLPSEFLLGASRFVQYKGLHLVIQAGEATGLPVVLAGRGPDKEKLQAQAAEASVDVRFVDSPSDALLYALYQKAVAFVFPAVEDFGIMPVEAIAAGGRVIVQPSGGAAETVPRLEGGSIVRDFSPAGWREALNATLIVDTHLAQTRSALFSSKRFRAEITQFVGLD